MSKRLIEMFDGLTINDTDQIVNILDNFNFPSKEFQAESLNQLREDLDLRYSEMQTMLQLSNSAWGRLVKGESKVQPSQLRLLLTQLLLRQLSPDLFDRLCKADVSSKHRAQFNIR